MESFLQQTARDLYARYGSGISSLHILFPSRRARLFFTEALAEAAQRPLWQPRWTTIDELMGEVSGLHTADRLKLIAELYKTYSGYHDEPFDKFYFWGDLLLNDFDTVDKYMVDARMLFANIADIKAVETPEDILREHEGLAPSHIIPVILAIMFFTAEQTSSYPPPIK